MGELGEIWRYSYWSERRVQSVAADNNIDLSRRTRFGITSPALVAAPQVQVTREPAAVQRHEIAARVERAIGQIAVEDFVTPPPARFVKGCGPVTFAAHTRWYPESAYLDPGKKTRKKVRQAQRTGVVLHTRTQSSDGGRIELCLFGSIDNCADYLAADKAEAPMWSSSSTQYIEEFLAHQGRQAARLYDDDESIAVEIIRTIHNQGMLSGHVFKRIASAEWFAEVYHDVELDKSRWQLTPGHDIPEPVDRIVIGAPLWIRSDGS